MAPSGSAGSRPRAMTRSVPPGATNVRSAWTASPRARGGNPAACRSRHEIERCAPLRRRLQQVGDRVPDRRAGKRSRRGRPPSPQRRTPRREAPTRSSSALSPTRYRRRAPTVDIGVGIQHATRCGLARGRPTGRRWSPPRPRVEHLEPRERVPSTDASRATPARATDPSDILARERAAEGLDQRRRTRDTPAVPNTWKSGRCRATATPAFSNHRPYVPSRSSTGASAATRALSRPAG